MSRLETGQGRPTVELLLALSHAYRVPLNDLVAVPEEGDPRIRLNLDRVEGRTVIPLTRQPDGMQARKIVIPTSKVTPIADRDLCRAGPPRAIFPIADGRILAVIATGGRRSVRSAS